MSECSGPQLTNTPENQRFASIGKSFPGFETKIEKVENSDEINEDDGGEICMRGRNVMMGYLGNKFFQSILDSMLCLVRINT